MADSVEVDDCELDYDMWDGQFDFVGPLETPVLRDRLSSSLSLTEDLFTGGPVSPHINNGLNGGKKTPAHLWCENMSDQVQLLQQQVTSLADTQNTSDDRYARAKADNAVLQARIHMLDEQIREIECRCEERMSEEQRRCREAVARAERERDQQVGALAERLQAVESEAGELRQEVGRLRGVAEGLRMAAEAEARRTHDAHDQLADFTLQLQQANEQLRKQRTASSRDTDTISSLQAELERLREQSPPPPAPPPHDAVCLDHLHAELAELRQQNKSLCEANEELQAQMLTRGVEQGRSLLAGVTAPLLAGHPDSLAQELQLMSSDQLDGSETESEQAIQLDKLQKTLKEQQDVNLQLRSYIDGILLSIVEHYPQLLDIKYQKRAPS